MTLNICTKFHENVLDGIKVIERTQFSYDKMSTVHNSIKHVSGVKALFLYTSSDSGLYLYKVS